MINVLPPAIYNLIAAGEVVDRPSSIVKELVENSIDAFSTEIAIEVVDGGITSIKVVDNGKGMNSDDLHKCILPHATSKIADANDLDKILSLGFRGEALASIAAVATVTITSKQVGQDGYRIKTRQGMIVESGVCGCSDGTSILVENLFDTIPARKKFLKKPSTELSYITQTVERLILANYMVAFKYFSNNKAIFESNGTNLINAIYSVWGELSSKMVEVNAEQREIKAYGYIADIGVSKHSTEYQLLVINGRAVQDSGISRIVFNCFADLLMTRQYPIFIINIELDPMCVDVNIHPNKSQVRFSDKEDVNRVVIALCRQVLFKAVNDNINNNSISSNDSLNNTSDYNTDKTKSNQDATINNNNNTAGLNIKSLKLLINNKAGDVLRESAIGFKNIAQSNTITTPTQGYISYPTVNNKDAQDNSIQLDSDNQDNANIDTPINTVNVVDNYATIVGRLWETYILLQTRDSVYLVDQHAAHEKLLYDKLCEEIDSSMISIQNLLVPYVFELSAVYCDSLQALVVEFENVGIEIRQVGDRQWAVVGVPTVIGQVDFNVLVTSIVEILANKKQLDNKSIIASQLKQLACKSAIKAKQALSDKEIESLITSIQSSDMQLYCPHGRPISYRLDKQQVEKWFKRIV